MRPIVAIVGRPNVGKSTLFNRLIGERKSIVEDQPGITRDRIYGLGEWQGSNYILIDTGGLELESADNLKKQMFTQIRLALDEAEVILFMVDAREGVTPEDREAAELLRREQKPVILVVNKTEGKGRKYDHYDFYELGFEQVVPISALHGTNTGDLLDKVSSFFADSDYEIAYPEDSIKISFVGRPNVGKSSIINSLLGTERVIVSATPGTTKEAVDTIFEIDDRQYILIDTAGMRKKSKVDEGVERFSVIRALSSVRRSDAAVLVLDCSERLSEQDKKIAGFTEKQGKALAIAINKWDLSEQLGFEQKEYAEYIRRELNFVDYAPLVFCSAIIGTGILDIIDTINYIAEQHSRRVKTGVLNRVISDAVAVSPPQSYKGRRLKIYYVTQVSVQPPLFVFFVNDPSLLSNTYRRYLENALREHFGFSGTPLRIETRDHKKN